MENKSTGSSEMINWLTKLTRKITSGKIVPMHYGEHLPGPVTDSIRDARAVWVIRLSDSTFDLDGLLANCERRGIEFSSPTHNKRRIMFPCPVHNELDSEARADLIRRSKLAQNWGAEVKWIDHEILESMIIVNPPSKNSPDSADGIALIDLSLPHVDTTGRAKFEITQKHQSQVFSDLVKSFSLTWTHGHDPHYQETKTLGQDIKTKRVLKGILVA